MSCGVALKHGEYEVYFQSRLPGHLSLGLGALSVALLMGKCNPGPKANEGIWVVAQRNEGGLYCIS